MSFGPFQSLFDQCMIQIDHLLMIALCGNGFAGFQEFIINNAALVPPDTKHVFFCRSYLVLALKDRHRWGTATIFSTSDFQNKSTFCHQSQFGTEMTFLALKQYSTSDFAIFHTVFHIEISTFKLSKPCLTCSNRCSVFTTSK